MWKISQLANVISSWQLNYICFCGAPLVIKGDKWNCNITYIVIDRVAGPVTRHLFMCTCLYLNKSCETKWQDQKKETETQDN